MAFTLFISCINTDTGSYKSCCDDASSSSWIQAHPDRCIPTHLAAARSTDIWDNIWQSMVYPGKFGFDMELQLPTLPNLAGQGPGVRITHTACKPIQPS